MRQAFSRQLSAIIRYFSIFESTVLASVSLPGLAGPIDEAILDASTEDPLLILDGIQVLMLNPEQFEQTGQNRHRNYDHTLPPDWLE